MPADHGFGFLGRTSERDRLDAMLAEVRAGRSAALVIRGEAGVGKTALLRYAGRQASGLRVTEIAGVQAEMELAFAGIHRLCTPMLARADVLPEPASACTAGGCRRTPAPSPPGRPRSR